MWSYWRTVWVGLALITAGIIAESSAGEIVLNIRNVRSNQGFLLAALHNSDKSFPDKPGALMYLKVKAKTGRMQLRFSVETPGKYAISMFHDENNNGILDTFAGIPTEGYGFSNNARGDFGPPRFSQALLSIDGGEIVQFIELTY